MLTKSVLGAPVHSINDYNKIPRNLKIIFFKPINRHEIAKVIDKLPNKTSSSYDNITNVLLKRLKDSITVTLTLIINKSITFSEFPEKNETS